MNDRAHWKAMLPIIQAFVDGKEVEFNTGVNWEPIDYPPFNSLSEYRIKPKAIVIDVHAAVVPSGEGWYAIQNAAPPNIRITFDPETHEPIASEIIK